jgi:phenol hydroxylase P1 protein
VSIEIKTAAIEPLRLTFDHLAERLGEKRAPSRYQEAVYDLQPALNFHYRPTWAPQYELYDASRTALRHDDWDQLFDPRQFYYASYVLQRSRQQDAQESELLAGLGEVWRAKVRRLVIPLRHVEWGANQLNCFIAAYGFGAPLTSAATFQMMDRLGNAQYLSRIGLLLSGNDPTVLETARQTWLEDPMWQPLRRLVEDLLVTTDWFEVHVAQNFVLDAILHPLVFDRFDRELSANGGGALALLTRFIVDWFAESCRWVDAVIRNAAAHDPANRATITAWFETWRQRAGEAAQPLAGCAFGESGEQVLEGLLEELDQRAQKIGLG